MGANASGASPLLSSAGRNGQTANGTATTGGTLVKNRTKLKDVHVEASMVLQDVVGADNMVGEARQVAGGCVVFVAVHVSITIEPFPESTFDGSNSAI